MRIWRAAVKRGLRPAGGDFQGIGSFVRYLFFGGTDCCEPRPTRLCVAKTPSPHGISDLRTLNQPGHSRLCRAEIRARPRGLPMSKRLHRCYNGCFMIDFLLALVAALRVLLRSRTDLALEILALRQQVAVLKRKHPRPPLKTFDRLFWIALRRFWPCWKDVLLIVKPDTVVGWRRTAFRWYWRWRSRRPPGRPPISQELRTLIRRLAQDNPGWGAPRMHGELRKLGFDLCERT